MRRSRSTKPSAPPLRVFATWAVYDRDGDVLTRGIRCSISLTAEQAVASAHAAAAAEKPFARRVVVTYRGDVVAEELLGEATVASIVDRSSVSPAARR